MRIIAKLLKKFVYFILYALLFILISWIIIGIFGLVLLCSGIDNPFRESIYLWWDIESNYGISSEMVIVAKSLRYIAEVAIIGAYLVKFTEAVNPFAMANNILLDTVDKTIVFRYWIMYPTGKYLYNTRVGVKLLTPSDRNYGTNHTHGLWESKELDELPQARGIRYIELSPKESKDLLLSIYKNRHNKGIYILVSLSGSDSSGKTYTFTKSFNPKLILKGYKFVPFREYGTSTFLNPSKGRQALLSDKNLNFDGHPRYQYFDKIYEMHGSKLPLDLYLKENKKEKKRIQKAIVSKKELEKKTKISDIFGMLLYTYLDSNLSRKVHSFFNS